MDTKARMKAMFGERLKKRSDELRAKYGKKGVRILSAMVMMAEGLKGLSDSALPMSPTADLWAHMLTRGMAVMTSAALEALEPGANEARLLELAKLYTDEMNKLVADNSAMEAEWKASEQASKAFVAPGVGHG